MIKFEFSTSLGCEDLGDPVNTNSRVPLEGGGFVRPRKKGPAITKSECFDRSMRSACKLVRSINHSFTHKAKGFDSPSLDIFLVKISNKSKNCNRCGKRRTRYIFSSRNLTQIKYRWRVCWECLTSDERKSLIEKYELS